MSKAKLIEQQWVDIVIPPPPESEVLMWWLLAAAVCFSVAFISGILWRQQPRQRLKRSINSLLRVLSQKPKSATGTKPKQILQQLEKALCQHCHVAQLIHIESEHSQWPLFREQLQQASYQAKITDYKQAQTLLKQANRIFLDTKTGENT